MASPIFANKKIGALNLSYINVLKLSVHDLLWENPYACMQTLNYTIAAHTNPFNGNDAWQYAHRHTTVMSLRFVARQTQLRRLCFLMGCTRALGARCAAECEPPPHWHRSQARLQPLRQKRAEAQSAQTPWLHSQLTAPNHAS